MQLRFFSLAARNALVYFVLFIIGLGVSGFLILSYSSTEILNLAEQRLEHTGEMVQLKFETYLEGLERDLDQLADSPLLNRYSTDTSLLNLTVLKEEYLSVLKNKPNYYQIRLISSRGDGKELIRVERKAGALIETPEEELQFKGGRDYFSELSELPLDSTYFSRIDLNKEHGEISLPLIPTLRMGRKIRKGFLKDVFLVVNVDLESLFGELNQLASGGDELRVVNDKGHYLIHPDSTVEFTFEYGKEGHYANEYDISLVGLSASDRSSTTNDGVSRSFHLNYSRSDYGLYTIVSSKNSSIFASFYAWRKRLIFILLSVALAFLIIAFIYMRKQVKELKTITAQFTVFSDRIKPSKLTISRNDEIGALAKGFEQMSEKVAQSQEQMEFEKKRAEEAYREKNAFLENMSHEIRNPLQSILGTTQILTQNSTNNNQKPFVDSLRFSANQLNALVTDILDYGKIKSGQIVLEPDWTDLGGFCHEMINSLKYQANSKNVGIALKMDEALTGKLFYFDRLRLYQILNNLLSNAIKFTPKEGRVMLEVLPTPNESEGVRFSVKDTGSGIVEEEIYRITDRNYTSNYSTGTGLGLTIVVELLRMYNSELIIHSELGEGSEFSFDLKIKPRSKPDVKRELRMTDDRIKGKRILIVEDDTELQNWYRHILKDNEIHQCFRTEALNELEERFDIIISDLMFDEKSVDLEAHIRFLNTLKVAEGLIIIVSGTKVNYERSDVLSFVKPVSGKGLIEEINRFLKGVMYGIPDFSGIEKDYDFNTALVVRATGLLIKEWTKESLKLKEAMFNANSERFDGIKHKIITSLRRLKLEKFESRLDLLSEKLKQGIQPDNKEQEEVLEGIAYFIEELKQYELRSGMIQS